MRLCSLALFNAVVEFGCFLFSILLEELLKFKEKYKLNNNYISKFCSNIRLEFLVDVTKEDFWNLINGVRGMRG